MNQDGSADNERLNDPEIFLAGGEMGALRKLDQPHEAMNAAAAALGIYPGVDRCGDGEVDPSGAQPIVGGHDDVATGDDVMLAVCDTGAGMPGPLRSTELASLARRHIPGLPVLYASGYSEGTSSTMVAWIPVSSCRASPLAARTLPAGCAICSTARSHPPRTEENMNASASAEPCVLLVEDDALIRMATADMLTDMGYRCREAGSGEDALAMLDKHDIDILMTDLGLPGMSGQDLVANARKERPELRVILASGTDAHTADDGPGGRTRTVMLIKPFGEQELRTALKTLDA